MNTTLITGTVAFRDRVAVTALCTRCAAATGGTGQNDEHICLGTASTPLGSS